MSQVKANLPNKILVVDDDPTVAQGLEEPLSRYNIKVDKAVPLETAFYLFNQFRYDVVLVEIEYEPLPGLALVQKWREHEIFEKRCTGFIMMSGNKSLGTNEGLVRELGDLEVINKPFSLVQLLPFLSRALATKKRLLAYHEMKQKIDSFYAKSGNFEKAAEQVQKMLPELGPKGLHMLYDLYEKAGRLDDALAIVGPLADRDPNNIALINARGRLLMRLGRFEEAKPYLEKADQLAPHNIDRINQMADMYLRCKEPDKAVGKMRDLVQFHPEKPDIKFDQYTRLFDAGYDDHAIAYGKESALPTEIVRHYNNKGVMLSKDENHEGALREYDRALKFFPNFKENYRILFNIALAKIQEKNRASYEEAVEVLKRCLELSPDFEKARKTLETVEKALAKKKAS